MLLRRITEHVKAQNWTAVCLDFFIVVVGVFIGIQVANLNDARHDRDREVRHLEEIAEDLRADLAIFEDIELSARARITAVNIILEGALGEAAPQSSVTSMGPFVMPEGQEPEPGNINHLLGWANLVRISDGNQTGFDALISAGNLGLIRDRSISRGLQRYYAGLEDMMDTQLMLRDVRNNGVQLGYSAGLSAFEAIEPDDLFARVRENDAYAAYLKTTRQWAGVHLSVIQQQQASAQALVDQIDTYLN